MLEKLKRTSGIKSLGGAQDVRLDAAQILEALSITMRFVTNIFEITPRDSPFGEMEKKSERDIFITFHPDLVPGYECKGRVDATTRELEGFSVTKVDG